ncbi:hypothetical protein OS493_007242 [Desmophyllum pertusum]|uniref:PB1 domain-containing protein n=1 Tax=Desmophyllum pertusum TaxID=174260 RepID=A0A9X0D104_9CNID|nr:hypothetical protein OS493_007242 [Desmophyllum pertusum]
MATIQFKIFYGENFDRCKMYRMDKICLELATYEEFATAVLQTIGTYFQGKSPREVRIQYRDDEDTFVSLSSDSDLLDACRCLRPVPNTEDLYRLIIRVHGSATPVAAVSTEKTVAEKRRSILPPKQLNFQDSKLSFRNTSFPSSEPSKFRSPLDVFLDEKKKAVEAQKQQVANARASFSECELMCSASPDARNTRKPVLWQMPPRGTQQTEL